MNMQAQFKSRCRAALCCVLFGMFATTAVGVTYYVDASKPAGGDGLTWATAFNNIQAGIAATNPTWIVCTAPVDRVWVKQGTYTLTSQLTVGSADILYGGFPSSIANPVWEDRNWRSHPTIIDGNNAVRCVNISGYAILDGFIIQNGSADSGAGVYVNATPRDCGVSGYLTPYIQNCWIRNNTASTGSGGGLYDNQSDAHIRYCEFSDNSAAAGGAIYQLSSGTEIIRCSFHNNESTAPGSLGGGAIAGWGHNSTTGKYVAITNCLFYSNVSASWGGAIAGNQIYPTITNSTFSGNEATIAGGAFFGNTNSEAPRLRNCILWGDSPEEISLVTASTYLDVSYCDIQGGWTGPGSNNINLDPLFKSAANYHLQAGSPCMDTASNAYAPADDLDGQARPLDGDNDGEAIADRGAYEETYTNVDLVVQSIVTDPKYPRVGQPCEVTVSLRNQGTTAASAFWLDWYAHRAAPPTVHQYGDKYQRFASLAGGTTTSMTRSYTYPAPGVFSMYAQADTEQEVEETNEGNNVLGPKSVKVIKGELLDFNTQTAWFKAASQWFGGDDRLGMTRNVGAGQIFIPVREALVQSVAFHFNDVFDYYQNPEGHGHAVRLYVNVRNDAGTILRTVYTDVPASFRGGWVTFTFGTTDLWLTAGQEYIFTCFLYKGEVNQYTSGITGRSDNPWPLCSGYEAVVTGSPADMQDWANWNDKTWDFNIHITGQYVEPYPADLDSDWSVGLADAQVLAAHWLDRDCLMLDWCQGCDINWSMAVKLEDFAVLSAFWGKTYPAPLYSELDAEMIAGIYDYGHLSGTNIDSSDGNKFNPGTYFVYRTSQGRLGKFLVENLEPAVNHRLTIAWVTYNADGSVYSSGSGLTIQGTYSCDLDLGAETPTGRDFSWPQINTTTRYLDPNNSALFKLVYRAP